jgi:hypothetical protein
VGLVLRVVGGCCCGPPRLKARTTTERTKYRIRPPADTKIHQVSRWGWESLAVSLTVTHQNVKIDAACSPVQFACVWLRPEAVARIEFLVWTEADRLRHSKFAGLREDKSARLVVKEQVGEA